MIWTIVAWTSVACAGLILLSLLMTIQDRCATKRAAKAAADRYWRDRIAKSEQFNDQVEWAWQQFCNSLPKGVAERTGLRASEPPQEK